jgi:hypothetical protein
MLGEAVASQSRFADAEAMLIEAAELIEPTEEWRILRTGEAIQRVVDLYTDWHEAEPEAGYDAKAAEWRAKLEELTSPADS